MTLQQLEKLYNTNDPNNISLASNAIMGQLSTKNIYSLLSMLLVKYYSILESDKVLKSSFEDKLKESCWKGSSNISSITVSQILSHLLSSVDTSKLKELKEVREYYILYIDSLILQQEYKLNPTIEDEGSTTPF